MFSFIGMLPYLITALVLGTLMTVALRGYLCWALKINEQLKTQRKLLEELRIMREEHGKDMSVFMALMKDVRDTTRTIESNSYAGAPYRTPPKEG